MQKDDEKISKLKQRGVTVLSNAEGKFPLIQAHQEMMCLLSNGYLVVLTGEENNLDVRQYRMMLKNEGFVINRTVTATIGLLRRLYQELGEHRPGSGVVSGLANSTSARQSDVIRMISEAVKRKASDIHVTIFETYATISYRIHGDLYQVQEPPAEKASEMCATIYQSMCDIADPTYRPQIHQDARMKPDFVARCGLFGSRIASGPTDSGSLMVIRLLYDAGDSIPTLEQLGYLPEQIEMINVMRQQTSGINVLSGATGSGKSTTLVSVLDAIIRDSRESGRDSVKNSGETFEGVSVMTIEDPPEYKIRGAKQTPLIADKSDEASIRRGWSNSIKACMRKDPDYLMIGEIRDPGSAKAAFDAAMTGHGVWTTVHVTDAVGIMMRLRGLEVETDRMLDPEIITGLINQSLVQKLCPHCSVPWLSVKHQVDPGCASRVEQYCDEEKVRVRGSGCSHCGGSGIIGRLVIAEVIIPNLEFMEVFEKGGKTHAKAHWVKNMGGITKCMALIRRINDGMVDPREGERSICLLDKERITMGLDYSKHSADHVIDMEQTITSTTLPNHIATTASAGVLHLSTVTEMKKVENTLSEHKNNVVGNIDDDNNFDIFPEIRQGM